jgi:hypothetical protein
MADERFNARDFHGGDYTRESREWTLMNAEEVSLRNTRNTRKSVQLNFRGIRVFRSYYEFCPRQRRRFLSPAAAVVPMTLLSHPPWFLLQVQSVVDSRADR